MLLRLHVLFAAAVFLFLGLVIAATSSDPNVSVALSSAPIANASASVVPTAISHNQHGILSAAPFSGATESDLVQVAGGRDNIPDEWRMAQKNWQGQASIEVSLLSDVINTSGNLTGPLLYGAVWENLNILCPDKIGSNDNPPCWSGVRAIMIRHKDDDKEGGWSPTYLQLRVISSKFGKAAARKPLFGALAAAYEAMTHNDLNCFTVKDSDSNNRYCNVAYQASVHTEDSHIYMSLISDIVDDKRYGDWKCCETREFVDTKLDTNGDVQRFKVLYPTKRNKGRLVECHMGCSSDQRVSSIDVDKMLVHVMDTEFF
ncbi:hypothetical protein N0V86_005303 [Didymella sp. IMI 355093]|nr:hypothetical protein N0V86_005303 [Didymella sp. IMI 355093]